MATAAEGAEVKHAHQWTPVPAAAMVIAPVCVCVTFADEAGDVIPIVMPSLFPAMTMVSAALDFAVYVTPFPDA
jgi:hypothetical protein